MELYGFMEREKKIPSYFFIITKHIANAYRLLFHGQTSVFDACIQIEQQVPNSPAIRNILEFVRGTEEGIISKL